LEVARLLEPKEFLLNKGPKQPSSLGCGIKQPPMIQ